MNQGPMDDQLRTRRLLVTAGTGGVGKTTVAAALGLRAALLGRRVVVLTIDPAQRLAQAMGLDGLTGELSQIDLGSLEHLGESGGELWAMMLDIKTTSDRMVERFSPTPEACAEILENDYYGYFSTALAGTQEYMAVEQVRRLMDDEGFDLVLLDTPPATHALDFLDAPDRLMDGLSSIPVKALSMEHGDSLTGRIAQRGRGIVLKGLKRFTGGPFLEDLTIFFGVFGRVLNALEKASQQVKVLLRSSQTQFLLITTPGRGNIDEAINFRGELRKRGFPLGGFIVNRVHPRFEVPPLSEAEVSDLASKASQMAGGKLNLDTATTGLASLLRVQEELNAIAERDAVVVDRLQMVGDSAPIVVPVFTEEIHDLLGLSRLAESMSTHGTQS
jgi:anion-transporting  ArsA/GET3 family ATPase